jgi:excinuclease ABC subunit B
MGLIESLTEQMRSASADLHFELSARFRDELKELKRELRNMEEAGH